MVIIFPFEGCPSESMDLDCGSFTPPTHLIAILLYIFSSRISSLLVFGFISSIAAL